MKDNIILEEVKEMAYDYLAAFENPPEINLCFSVSSESRLMLNDLEICDIDDIDLNCLYYDAEHIFIGPAMIFLDWQFKGEPQLMVIPA